MKIYLISQEVNDDYDTFDSAVVAAPDEETARDMDPGTFYPEPRSDGMMDWSKAEHPSTSWAHSREQVNVEYIGEAKEGTKQGVICASFNAG